MPKPLVPEPFAGSNDALAPDLPVAAPGDDTPEFYEGTLADGLDGPAAVSPAEPPEQAPPSIVLRHVTAELRTRGEDGLADLVRDSANRFLDERHALLAAGERDRQQIARLTEALREIMEHPHGTMATRNVARAVLAGEEDAE